MNSPALFHPVIALMTDFGTEDGYVGVMKGVIVSITPEVHLIDITHDIASQSIASGAWILASVYRYFPANTVFICVVDPGVGSSRGAIAVHAGDWFFVGPDNGLFTYIYQEQTVDEAVILSNPAYHLPQISSTFHGRDIFAPVGAYVARGLDLSKLGTQLDSAVLQRIDVEQAVRRGTDIDGQIVHVDKFGNLITNVPLLMVPELFSYPKVQIVFPQSGAIVDRRRRFFAEPPDSTGKAGSDEQPFIYTDSSGYIAIAVRNGNAAKTLHAASGTAITLVIVSK